jgi:N-acetylneuraminic acid mutarotase
MHKHKEAQEGHVELNIGGYRFQTSVQTLRRVPHTFFDAYFSGRYSQDVCNDGSIFVDRDGEHFGHILEYMRDCVVSVAEPGARPSVSLLRALKREFGFYCIELCAEQAVRTEQPEVSFVMGGWDETLATLSSMERYDLSSGQWSVVAAMGRERSHFGTCVVAGELYAIGGSDNELSLLSSVEKYSPSSDTWGAVTPLPAARAGHAAVAVGSHVYVLGGDVNAASTSSVLKLDTTQGTWSNVAPMPESRCAIAACAMGSNIFVFCGCDVDGEANQASVFRYDTMADAWSTLAPMPCSSADHSASVLDSLVYIVGAGDRGGDNNLLRFDPVSESWSTLAPTLLDRRRGCSFVLGGCLYTSGGGLPRESYSSVERYDAASNTWTIVGNMLEGRQFSGAVTIGSEGPAEKQDLFDALIAKASNRS